jgi:uncharacterized protein (TIGR00251 family)
MLNISETTDGLILEIKVQPRSAKNEIAGEQAGALKIKLTAAPVDGEANQALIKFLSDVFKVPKKNIMLLKGETSRHKLIEIKGISKELMLQKIGY